MELVGRILRRTAVQLLTDRRDRCAERLRVAAGGAAPACEDRDRDLRSLRRAADRRRSRRHGGGGADRRLAADGHPRSWRGALLLVYAGLAARRALNELELRQDRADGHSRRRVIAATLGLTWLNPAVYLDTLVLLGTVASSHPASRWWFGAGAGHRERHLVHRPRRRGAAARPDPEPSRRGPHARGLRGDCHDRRGAANPAALTSAGRASVRRSQISDSGVARLAAATLRS